MGRDDTDRWPPFEIIGMIAEMEHDPSSPHWRRAWRYVRRRARRLAHPGLAYRFEADDLAQEVMLILMRPGKLSKFLDTLAASGVSAPEVTPRSVFLRFVHIIVRRTYSDMLRPVRADTKYRMNEVSRSEHDAPEEGDPIDRITSGRPSVERQVEILEELEGVYRFLREHAARDNSTARKVGELWRSALTGDDYQRIAEQFERDPDAVRLDIFRIREKLRQAIPRSMPRKSGRRRSEKAEAKASRSDSANNANQRKRKSRQAKVVAHLALAQPLPPIIEPTQASLAPGQEVPRGAGNASIVGDGHRPSAGTPPSLESVPAANQQKGQTLS